MLFGLSILNFLNTQCQYPNWSARDNYAKRKKKKKSANKAKDGGICHGIILKDLFTRD